MFQSTAKNAAAPGLVGLVMCGCCYGQLTEPGGFPLSNTGIKLRLALGYVARDLATHQVHGIALDPCAWAARVEFTSSYRAVLAQIVVHTPFLMEAVGLSAITKFATVKKNLKHRPVSTKQALVLH
eukprot:SAG31_NODE_479_length_15133_cov_39.816283_10_plen_126_part_00